MSLDNIIPKVSAKEAKEDKEDEEPEEEPDLVDPAVVIKEECSEDSHCAKYKTRLEECTARVNSKNKTSETCYEEVMDFVHCVDHCAAPKIFKTVK